jgi:hypothetical protein
MWGEKGKMNEDVSTSKCRALEHEDTVGPGRFFYSR